MKWIRLIDNKPIVPENKYGVTCIVASFDPCYDEIHPSKGYTVTTMIYKNNEFGEEGFYSFMNDGELVPTFDVVTHWMYLPIEPNYDPEVLNPIFKYYHEHSYPQTSLKQI